MQSLKQWFLVHALLLTSLSFAQQANKALTNDDVVSMVKSSLPEDVILNAIQANETNFDTSANALIALQKASVDSKVMNAMLAAAARRISPSHSPTSRGREQASLEAGILLRFQRPQGWRSLARR